MNCGEATTLARRSHTGKLIVALLSTVVALLIYWFAPQPTPVSADGMILGVTDGDTLIVRVENRKETVRLIGIDAPETAKSPRLDQMAEHSGMSRKRIAQMGEESKKFVEKECRGATNVRLEFDAANAPSHRDKYDRLLAYVLLKPKDAGRELFLNEDIVRQGYARAYTSYRFRYSREFRAYEAEAHDGRRGLWATGDLP